MPGYINHADDLRNKGIDSIYCLSVNDPSVMKAWQSQYPEGNKIIMIADGNADLTKTLELEKDFSMTGIDFDINKPVSSYKSLFDFISSSTSSVSG